MPFLLFIFIFHSLNGKMSQPQSNGQTLPLLSPTVSTSRISSSAVASPIEHANMGDILESQIMSHIKTGKNFFSMVTFPLIEFGGNFRFFTR